jgi:flagellar protein FliS
MVRNNPRQQYREIHLVSSSPGETVLMLYDGAIRFVKEAAGKIAESNIPAKLQLLEKAEKIIEYLTSCVNRENGGEIARNLQSLYGYMLVRLTEANLYNDVAKLEEIVRLLGTVREGWVSICGAAKEREVIKPSGQEKEIAASKNITVRV